jgi:large-conductance mechanosensitive channel
MDFKNELGDFISRNGIIGLSAGVIIGLVTKDVVLSLVTDIVVPLFVILLVRLNIKSLTAVLPGKGKSRLNITNFISYFISWILGMILTYFFIQYAFIKLLGAKEKK